MWCDRENQTLEKYTLDFLTWHVIKDFKKCENFR